MAETGLTQLDETGLAQLAEIGTEKDNVTTMTQLGDDGAKMEDSKNKL